MRAPHHGRHSPRVSMAVGVAFFVAMVALLLGTYDQRHDATAKTPPADMPTPALAAPAPHVFEYVDNETGCRYLGSSVGGMTARMRVPPGAVGPVAPVAWCGKVKRFLAHLRHLFDWNARRRAMDLKMLWPTCVRLAPNLDQAKARSRCTRSMTTHGWR
jgi:hypothetical protein